MHTKYSRYLASCLFFFVIACFAFEGESEMAPVRFDCLDIPGFAQSPFSTKEPEVVDETTSTKVKLCFNPEDRKLLDTVNFRFYDYSFLVEEGVEPLRGITGCGSRVYFSEFPVDILLDVELHYNKLKWFRRLDDGKLLIDAYDVPLNALNAIVVSNSNGGVNEYLCVGGFWFIASSA